MSYDFWLEIDTGGPEPFGIEPSFDDRHPALDSDGHAGNVLVTFRGYTRCGNYTSNVGSIWSKCLTAVATEENGDLFYARAWIGDNDRLLAARVSTVAYFEDGVWKSGPVKIATDYLWLSDLDGKRCAEVALLLKAAVDWGVEHLDELRPLEPSNGWGDAPGAVTYLWDIQRMCERHPNATLRFSY